MKQYKDLIKRIMSNEGVWRDDRTGTGTVSVFGHQMRFNLVTGFPLLTTKKLHFKSIVHELLWLISGSTCVRDLQQHGVSIWDSWADENGDLGPVYGKQWRAWSTADGRVVDQLQAVIDGIKADPDGRRHIVSAWNVGDLGEMALPPCHSFFQFYVAKGHLSCQLYQRSADVFLGLPFTIAAYALLTHMVAQVCGLNVGELVVTLGDAHIYKNHLGQANEIMQREPHIPPMLELNPRASIDEYVFDDVQLVGYDAHPHIKGEVAV